jgi:glyoxylase I family protein
VLHLNKVHHIAAICRDYERSKDFYTRILGLSVIRETYREERKSYKLDLALHGQFVLELFTFPDVPDRLSFPEAAGLRHLAFEVDSMDEVCRYLGDQGIPFDPVRIDSLTGKQFTFIADPDGLPIEFYEK